MRKTIFEWTKYSWIYLVIVGAIGLSIYAFSNSSYTCEDLPNSFSSYQEADELILNATYPFTDEVNTSKSSWIRSAWYLSCDGKKGFFCYTTDKKLYIHQNVPLDIWHEFKNADSFGRYYNYNIKGKYRLKLK